MDELVVDALMKETDPEFGGKPKTGTALFSVPGNQQGMLDFTTNIGGCSGLYYSLVFQFPKWGYKLKKLDEDMDVSPAHAEAYGLIVEQKGKLEKEIKGGLASAAQAVADFELLKHDLNKYEEMIHYFQKAKGSVREKKEPDQHVLRSLFIDRVDAHTGEGFSMVTMARRWPTIISDFIKMSKLDEATQKDPEKLRAALSVTIAEANVLKTKNELFNEWKKMFFDTVKERYARIKNLVQAREKSMYQYREWLKPYVARYHMMKEALKDSPAANLSNVYMAPAFGTASVSTNIRFIAFDNYWPPEMSKAERSNVVKIAENGWVDPTVREWADKIAAKYEVDMNNKRVEEILESAYKRGDMQRENMYYRVFVIKAEKFIVKIPKGGEVEDITFRIKHWITSQNILLIFLLEIAAREEVFERYVKTLIGDESVEKEIKKKVDAMFEEPEEEKPVRFAGLKRAGGGFKKFGGGLKKVFSPLKYYLFRKGPYETNFQERVTKMYMIPSGQIYNKLTAFLKWKAGVPGAPEQY